MSTDYDYLRQRWVSVVNDTDEYVPAYGAMRITGVVPADSTDYPEEIGTFTIAKPNAANLVTGILFNGTFPLAPGSSGLGTMSFPTVMAYEIGGSGSGSGSSGSGSGSSHPTTDDAMGTQEDSWYLLVGNYGFVADCAGAEIDASTGYVVGERKAPGQDGGEVTLRKEFDSFCWIACSGSGSGSGSSGSGSSGSGSGPAEVCINGRKLVAKYRMVDPRTNATISTTCEDIGECDGVPCDDGTVTSPCCSALTGQVLPGTYSVAYNNASGTGCCLSTVEIVNKTRAEEDPDPDSPCGQFGGDYIGESSCLWFSCCNVSETSMLQSYLIINCIPGDPDNVLVELFLSLDPNIAVGGDALINYYRAVVAIEDLNSPMILTYQFNFGHSLTAVCGQDLDFVTVTPA